MGTFKAYFKKEIMESLRQYRYLLLAVGTVVFAGIASPIMMKLLPVILKGQFEGDINTLFKVTKQMVYSSYSNDIFETSSIFIFFGLSGIMSEEISASRLTFPYLKGARPWQIVSAKALHYILTLSILIMLGAVISYFYIGIMFEGANISLNSYMTSSILICLYYAFFLMLLTYVSSLFKKGIVAGIIVLLTNYLTSAFAGLKVFKAYSPYKLITSAAAFSTEGITYPIIFVIIGCIIFAFATTLRLKKIEVI
jgi:ABC-2 type transport system permease protein